MRLKNSITLPVFLLFFVFAHLSCAQIKELVINTAHLDYLYEEIEVEGKDMAIIHIYSDAPDYKFVGDDDEGIACIDDVARAAIFYLKDWQINKTTTSLNKNKLLLEFVLHLQAENGYFYNFIWEDYSINRDFKTSVAEPNWWSWRALWVLSESYLVYKNDDPVFADRIWTSIEKLITSVKNDIPVEQNKTNIAGLTIPSWLPNKHASDQTAVLLLGLSVYHQQTNDEVILNYIKKLCQGITQMQIIDEASEVNGAFLSWENSWHAWGNSQSYALLKSYKIINDDELLHAALRELDQFYDYLIETNYLMHFNVTKEAERILVADKGKFSQIAYNIRPMIFALLEASDITKNEKYSEKAAVVASWFFGNNRANAVMYDEKSGRIYDGINSEEDVNKNSGAESTIEGLLSLISIKSDPASLKYFLQNE
ncbi:MAG: hypothetical protein K9J12_05355 [Melioribacteraceae bacterium]|nr:hypothetical protein [Melioribacteraceae bacterium]MCF8264476.1 hypothetical protein [Melioribacteraceae bacterium]